jgi:hypothetical protein
MRYTRNLPAVALLEDRFNFTFIEDERLMPIQDYLYGLATLLEHEIGKMARSAERVTEELGYVVRSLHDSGRSIPFYLPLGGFSTEYAALADVLDDRCRMIQMLVAAIDETRDALAAADAIGHNYIKNQDLTDFDLATAETIKDEPTEASDA